MSDRWEWSSPSIVGQKFDEWTVIKPAWRRGKVTARCSCGVEREVFGGNLARGYTRCCGDYSKHPKLKPNRARRGNAEWQTWREAMREYMLTTLVALATALVFWAFFMAIPWAFEAIAYSGRHAQRYFEEPAKPAEVAELPCLMPMVELEADEPEPSWASQFGK